MRSYINENIYNDPNIDVMNLCTFIYQRLAYDVYVNAVDIKSTQCSFCSFIWHYNISALLAIYEENQEVTNGCPSQTTSNSYLYKKTYSAHHCFMT